MILELTTYLPLLAVFFSAALGFYVARRGSGDRTTRLYMWLNFAIAFFAFGAWIQPNMARCVRGWSHPQLMQYVALVFGQLGDMLIPVWVMFAASYAGQRKWLGGPRLFLVWAPFAAGFLVALTDPWHHGWSGATPSVPGSYGTLFPYYFVVMALQNLWGQVFFVRMVFETGEARFRRQAALMALASFVPLLANLAYYFGPDLLLGWHWKYLNVPVLSFVFTDICFFYILFRLDFLDFMPLALAEVFSSVSDPILLVSTRMVVIRVNKAARELIPQAVPGALLPDLFPEFSLPVAERAKAGAATVNEPVQLQFQGREYLVRMIDVRPHRERAGLAVMFTDITDLTRARKEAWAAGQAQTRFLMKMSHQLRNPLQGIIGYNEILAGRLAGEDQVLASRSLEQARRMLGLVNDLIDFSRATREPEPGERKALSLRRLADELKSSMSERIQSKGLRFDVILDASLPASVMGDLRSLRQVLLNLLENAQRFTAHGYVMLQIRLGRREGNKVEVRFLVEDTGRGMDAEEQRQAFQAYNRFDLTARDGESSGLGLPLSRALVQQQGGVLELESQAGRGTRVSFALLMEEEKNQPRSPERAPAGRGGVCVLIAEDQAMNRELIHLLVTGWGCLADTAEDGRRAFELFMERHYDLVLLDIQMPEMNGFEVASAIRALPDPARSRVPIIALTGHAYADRGEGDVSLMNDWLIKPVPSLDLQAAIWKWTGRQDGKPASRGGEKP